MSKPSNFIIGAFLSFLGAILFSTKAVFVKLAYQYEVDSVSLLTFRMVFSLPFFAAVAVWSWHIKKQASVAIRNNWWSIVAFGLSGYYLASYLDLEGLQYIDASLERIVLFMYPSLVILLSYVWLKQPIVSRHVYAILITYAGIGMAFGGNLMNQQDTQIINGVLLVSGSALAFAVYLVGSQRALPGLGTWLYNSLTMLVSTVAILAHQVLFNKTDLTGFAPQVYIYGLLIATVSTVIPSYMVMEGIRRIGANNSSIIGTIGPISTIILAYILLEERMNAIQWGGSLLVLSGVLLIVLQRRRVSGQADG